MRLTSLVALASVVSSIFLACGEDGAAPVAKKGTGKGGGGGSSAAGGSGGGAERPVVIGGACTAREMAITVGKDSVAIDCDVWRGPHAMIEVFEGLDKCCTVADRARKAIYESFTPQLALAYKAIAYQWQKDVDKGALEVDLARVEGCEAAAAGILPAVLACKGGVSLLPVVEACNDLVNGRIPDGELCADHDSCTGTSRCVGANLQDTSAAGRRCRPIGGVGFACQSSSSVPSLGSSQKPLCTEDAVCVSGKCEARAEIDATCLFDATCKSNRCAPKKCVPPLAGKVALGGDCLGPTDCVASARCLGGLCTDKGGEGAVCTPTGDDCRVLCDESDGKCLGLFCGIDRF